MKTTTKWALGIGVVALAGGLLLASSASASPPAPTGMKETGVRHGIRYEGCDHFDLADPAAIEAWGRDNALKFAKYLLKLDELRANPEPLIVEALQLLFPECPWPAPDGTTFGPQNKTWAEALAAATEAGANFDLATASNAAMARSAAPPAGLLVSRILTFGVRALPMTSKARS